jgi:hypothetical protein
VARGDGAVARELSVLRASPRPGDGAGNDEGGEVSRRRMLRLGAAAAAGAAATAGGLVGAQPAFAGSDGDLTLGVTSNGAAAPTGLSVSGSASKYGIGATDNGLSAYPNVEPGAALFRPRP